jgi:hypothetical protein
VALAGQPCRPLRAALLEKTGRDEEVVPAVEQRGYQKEERDETVLPGYRPIGALTTEPPSLLRFARAFDDVMA